MIINYLKGSRQEFLDFVESIPKNGKVAILSHTDLDGLSSAVFLEEILKAKRLSVEYLDFLEIKSEMVHEVGLKLKSLGITHAFFCDIGIDSIDFEGFKELRKSVEVFLIDHHPMNKGISLWNKIIKTDSQDCCGMTCFFLGEGIIDYGEWNWLVCSAIFSDFSYKAEKNFNYIKKIYPDVTYENISSSVPGINSRIIASALIYYKGNEKYVYDLVKERNLDKLREFAQTVEDEIDKLVEDFSKEKEYFEKSDIYFYEVKSNFNLASIVCTLVSKLKPESSFVFMQRFGDFVKFSARNQSSSKDMGELMKFCVQGLEGARGGGHKPAAAAKVREKDLEEFKKRLVSYNEI